MKIPVLLTVKVRSDEKKFAFFIFLPIIYLLLLPLFLIGLVVFALMILFRVSQESRKYALGLIVYLPVLFSSMHGTEILVNSRESDVKIIVR